MLKKGLITIFIIILVGIGIYSLIHLFSPGEHTNDHTPISEEENEPDSDDEEKNSEKEKEKEAEDTDEDTPISQKFSDLISDLIHSTADFFGNKETDVVAIGDSLTEGVGDATDNGGYVGIIDDIVNDKKQVATFENFGKRGNRTDQMLERMNNPEIDSALKDADIILITIGANDIMKIVKENITNLQIDAFIDERRKYENRLQDIFDGMLERNDHAEIYLLGFYNPFKSYFHIQELNTIVDEWNKTGEDLAHEYDHITFIPTKDLFDDADEEENLFSSDNFHPNTQGYQRMAKRVLEYVAE